MRLEKIKEKFYADNIKRYDTSRLQLIKILEINNFGGFKESRLIEYQFAVDAYFSAEREARIKRTDEAIEAQKVAKKKVWGVVQYYPCPVKGCEGKKVQYDGVGFWKCTVGGESHYHAFMVARMWKGSHLDDEKTIEERAAELVKNAEVEHAKKSEV